MEHDNSYKLLFSHPEMVADLLRGFVREEWVDRLDFQTLERVSGSFLRRFTLPESADAQNIRAKASNGVLEVVIPKLAQVQPRKIQVGQLKGSSEKAKA